MLLLHQGVIHLWYLLSEKEKEKDPSIAECWQCLKF